jgi:endogenous inhibitor of DNA gyrase (YacG/DUF329 family)
MNHAKFPLVPADPRPRKSSPRSTETGGASRCPTCRGPAAARSRNPVAPFCSSACKLADLGRWLDGSYRVAGEPMMDGDDREPAT